MNIRLKTKEPILLEAYKNAERLHEFFASFRYKVLGYLATVNAALFYFIFHEQPTQAIAISITIIGMLSVLALYLLDRRTAEVMQICIISAKSIEDMAHIRNNTGTYQKLFVRKPMWYSHKILIASICIVLILLWIVLFVISIRYPYLLNIKN
jgi:protein-S-isoprenylcysteine O-methyltransferase Ste14